MRIAIISDIHGNMEALKQVLDKIKHSKVNLTMNLGDSIGYGPDPESVLFTIIEKKISDILGNHEKAIIDAEYRHYSMRGASKSIEHTIKFLTPELISYIRNLPKSRIINNALFVHGCPPQSVTKYMNHLSVPEIQNAFDSFRQTICFVGHTHRLMLFEFNGEQIDFRPLKNKSVILTPGCKYIVNVGSVGQPRDRDPRAKFVIWDDESNTLEIERISYDINTTAEKIKERGFRKQDAARLYC